MNLPQEAVAAIARGLGDSVAVLETLGLNARYVNILERFGIITIGDLMQRNRTRLMSFPSLGSIGMRQILEALARYHEMPQDFGLHAEHEERKREVWERVGKSGMPSGVVYAAELDERDEQ